MPEANANSQVLLGEGRRCRRQDGAVDAHGSRSDHVEKDHGPFRLKVVQPPSSIPLSSTSDTVFTCSWTRPRQSTSGQASYRICRLLPFDTQHRSFQSLEYIDEVRLCDRLEETMSHVVAMADDHLEDFSSRCMALDLCASLFLFKKVNTRTRSTNRLPVDYSTTMSSLAPSSVFITGNNSGSRPKDPPSLIITSVWTRWLGWGW